MSIEALQLYVAFNILLTLLACVMSLHQKLVESLRVQFSNSFSLRLNYGLLGAFAIFALLLLLSPTAPDLRSSWVEISQGRSGREVIVAVAPFTESARSLNLVLPEPGEIPWLAALGWTALGAGLGAFLLEVGKLLRLLRGSTQLRRMRGVRIHYSERIREPFSLWAGALHIFLPIFLLENKSAQRVVIAHELQHHRQGDLRWAYVFCLLRFLCIWNPFAHLYLKRLYETQEFACDEVLVDRKHVPPQAYARHLYWVAQKMTASRPLCTSGFAGSRFLLRRRIEKMIKFKRTTGLGLNFALILASSAGFLAAAWGARGILQDKRVDLTEAKALATKAQTESFPLPVNEEVLKYLNFYLGTSDGRARIKDSLARMENYRGLVEKKLGDYSMPKELMAVPVVESGYQNLPESNKRGWGAGLWMFIKGTARNYGLRVDDETDERLNEERLTDAAMRYLSANQLRFGDWHLSLLAYNGGESKLQKLIDRTKSRDPWTLSAAGATDQGYLAKVIAVAIIMKTPELLQ